MTIHRWKALLVSGAGILFAGSILAQEIEEERGMLPVLEPQSLWEFMPGKMRTWELKESVAESRFDQWLEAKATRAYEKILEEAEGSEGAGESEPPRKTKISITDTARVPDLVSYFDNFEPGEDEEIERRMIVGYPAFLIPYGENELVIEMLVAKRFLVEITLENQPRRFVGEWVRRIDLQGLAAIPDTEIVPLPESVKILRVDQLNPDRNNAYLLATTSNVRMEQEIEEDEVWLQQMIGEIPSLEEEGSEGGGSEPGEGADENVPGGE